MIKKIKILIVLLIIAHNILLQAQVAPNVNIQQTQPISPILPDLTLTNTQAPVKAQRTPGTQLIEPTQIDEKKDQEEPNIYLNFENASLLSVVNYLGEQKKINLIPHKDLDATKVTLTTRNPLTLERAWNVLITLLEVNGFSIIKVNNIYRVVPNKDNGFEPLPTYSSGTGTEPENLPDSDMVIRYIYFFKTLKPEVAQSILQQMVADGKNILINKDLGACIIKDQCFNIKASMRILKELDSGGLREQIKIIPLTYTDADTISKLFQDILGQGDNKDDNKTIKFAGTTQQERTYFSSTTKIYADTVKNQLILLGNEKNLNKITEFIYTKLDIPIDDAQSRLHIYELGYAIAENLQPILTDIVKAPDSKNPIVGEYKYFEDVIISAEKTTGDSGDTTTRGGGNRLIIACNKDEWRRLKKFIEQLDKPQLQVALEVLFIDIEDSLAKVLGAQTYGFKGKQNLGLGTSTMETMNLGVVTPPTKTGSTQPVSNYMILASASQAVQGDSFVTLGRPGSNSQLDDNGAPLGEDIWSIINAKYHLTNSHVISQPYIIANNNQKCMVSIKDTVQVAGKLEATTSAVPIVKKTTLDAATTVTITPRINLDGIVDLNVKVDNTDITNGPTLDTPTLNTRNLTTRSTLLSGEVLVLGGLTKSTDSEMIYKTPILGNLPIIGNLFKYKEKTHKISNLYIFIRPSIIKPKFEGGADEYTQLKLDYAKYQAMKNDTYVTEKDPIQRWFFKPNNQSAHQALADRANGIFRPIDDFGYNKTMPKSVKINEDPYFRASEHISKMKKMRERSKSKKRSRSAKATTIKLTE